MENKLANQVGVRYEQNHFNLPIDQEIMFSDHKGIHKKKIEKRQTKLLKNLNFLNRFLMEDERILLVTTCCSPMSNLEQLMIGWIIVYLKRSMLVVTNRRILHIPTDIHYKYRNSIAQINYADCESIQLKRAGFSASKLSVKYKNNTKEDFHYVDKQERKKIKTLLETIQLEGKTSLSQKRINLCPRCTKDLQEEKYTCPHCHLEFKSKPDARKISIKYPGGGYFYTGHPFLGISDALGEAFLLLGVIVGLVDLISGAEGGAFLFVFFAISLIIEKVITVYHSNHFIKEYIPRQKEIGVPI